MHQKSVICVVTRQIEIVIGRPLLEGPPPGAGPLAPTPPSFSAPDRLDLLKALKPHAFVTDIAEDACRLLVPEAQLPHKLLHDDRRFRSKLTEWAGDSASGPRVLTTGTRASWSARRPVARSRGRWRSVIRFGCVVLGIGHQNAGLQRIILLGGSKRRSEVVGDDRSECGHERAEHDVEHVLVHDL